MAYERFTDPDTFYISTDGNYGGGNVIIANYSDFTQQQMDIIDGLHDNDRFWYVQALMTGDDVSEFEDQFDLL
jgi:hypothetical protein